MPIRRLWMALTAAAVWMAATDGAAVFGQQCPDLSGNYMLQGEDGQVDISIQQHGCDRITIIRKNNYLGAITSEKHVLKLDGKVQEDTPWLGSPRHFRTSAKFVGSVLQVEARATGDTPLALTYSLTPERDLREDTLVAKRQKSQASGSGGVQRTVKR